MFYELLMLLRTLQCTFADQRTIVQHFSISMAISVQPLKEDVQKIRMFLST
jgi:hypothetical protein